MKLKLLAAAILAAALFPLGAATLISSNFSDPVFNGVGANRKTVKSGNCSWSGFNGRDIFVSTDPAGGKDKVLQVKRIGSAALTIDAPQADQKNKSQQLRFKVLTGPLGTSSFHVSFYNRASKKMVGMLRFDGGNDQVFGIANGRQFYFNTYFPEAWHEYVVELEPGAEKYTVTRIAPDGQTKLKKQLPYANNLPVDQLIIGNIDSGRKEPNTTYLKDIILTASDVSSLKGRANVATAAFEAKATLNGKAIPKVNDGDVSRQSVVISSGVPAEFVIDLPMAQQVSSFRMFSGDLMYANNPSGDLAVKEYKVELMSTQSGFWYEVGHRKNIPNGKMLKLVSETQNQQFFDAFDFPAMETTAVKVTILDTHDTLRRADPNAKVDKTAIIREIELYSHEIKADRKMLNHVLEAEFRLPVYRDQERAELYMILDKSIPEMRVQLSFRERYNNTIPIEPMIITLKAGENIIPIDIKNWPNGQYRAGIAPYGKDVEVGGEFGRLLRLNRLKEPEPPQSITDMTGKTVYFPDKRYVKADDNVNFDIALPGVYRGSYPNLKPNHTNVQCDAVGFDADGRVYLSYRLVDRKFRGGIRYNSKYAPDLASFEYREGTYPNVDWTRSELTKFYCDRARITPEMNDKSKFRFYDVQKDGPVDVTKLKVIHVGYQHRDWGVVKPAAQSTWVLYEKDGEFLVMSHHPLLQDSVSSEEFETPLNSNDNMSGQYMSSDGKTLVYVRGTLLKRYAPFVSKYDNLWMVSRIMTVFTTQDGINWDRQFFGLPDENDPPNTQHYGADIYFVPGGNGLMISYTSPYRAREQQFYTELYYSWDGYNWKRYPGHQPWVPNDGPGGWKFGCINLHNNIGEYGNNYYHTIGWASSQPHFAGDYTAYEDRMKVLNGEYIRTRYQARDLEKWPYFKDFGSYEKLADSAKSPEAGSSAGIIVFRKNGWFKVSAQDTAGTLTTIPLGAKKDMKANVTIAENGFIRFTLLDTDGNPIPGYDKTLTGVDNAEEPVFDSLPGSLFQVKVELKNAELYGIIF